MSLARRVRLDCKAYRDLKDHPDSPEPRGLRVLLVYKDPPEILVRKGHRGHPAPRA